ncbi:MAG: polyprenyl synthetase family protein [candidate division Zixibacteria bacterium]|nr:polyprenyl synthetase family protein [candidate division Zixibacteria bacterium]
MSKAGTKEFPACLMEKRELVEKHLEACLPREDQYPQTLHAAIRYSVMAGGKRLRPLLAIAAFEACDGEGEIIYPAAAALELVHTYSLIHDDLPCMDDDAMRRGRPTLHRKYGEAVALLAGDALHDLAFRLMAQTDSAQAVLELAEAIGTNGMLAGQMADMEAEGAPVSEDDVTFIHAHKTGKLIRGSVRIGAVLAGASEYTLESISQYGERIGLAFQIVDDILDVEGDAHTLGKSVGSDTRNAKATFPRVIGLPKSKEKANQLIEEAVDIITTAVTRPDCFVELARFIGGRQS